MRNDTPHRLRTVPFLCLFLMALTPWLIAHPWHRHLLDLTVGLLITFTLTFAGTVLSRRMAAQRALIPAQIETRLVRREACRHRVRRRVW